MKPWYYNKEVNPPCDLATANGTHRFAVSIAHWLVDKHNEEINMIDREEKRLKKAQEQKAQYEEWRELSKAHWSHWRAWGSWFSWGSPVGLGLFFVLLALAGAILVWTIKL